jgi:LacI family transcriptional regulator
LAAHKNTTGEGLVFKVGKDFKKPDAIKKIAGFLEQHPELDAVVFATYYLGVVGLAAIRSLKLRIPEDIAVISFDDHDVFSSYAPEITAIQQPIEEIGSTAVKILLGEMGLAKKVKKQQVMIKAKLIKRASV